MFSFNITFIIPWFFSHSLIIKFVTNKDFETKDFPTLSISFTICLWVLIYALRRMCLLLKVYSIAYFLSNRLSVNTKKWQRKCYIDFINFHYFLQLGVEKWRGKRTHKTRSGGFRVIFWWRTVSKSIKLILSGLIKIIEKIENWIEKLHSHSGDINI